jgi:DNA-binding transcriptional MerR regulator
MDPENLAQKLSLDELSAAVGVSKRTIRYYMGLGLVARPYGETKGSYYSDDHLQQLAQVKTLSESGISLERIAQLLRQAQDSTQQLPSSMPGQLSVKSHIYLAPGIELVIDGSQAQLTTPEIRALASAAIAAIPTQKENK